MQIEAREEIQKNRAPWIEVSKDVQEIANMGDEIIQAAGAEDLHYFNVGRGRRHANVDPAHLGAELKAGYGVPRDPVDSVRV